MPQNLADKVIVVTGASSGIGAATAVACARAGMNVVLSARRADRLDDVAVRIRSCGRQAELVAGDVTDPGMAGRLLDAAQQRFRRFDVVLANAGYGLNKAVHELSESEWRRIFEVNFFAATALLAEAARRLIAQRRPGHLLMTSSCVAKFTLPRFAAYTTTKAAQNHVCRAMRMELRPFGIEVSSVHPITTDTEFFAAAAELSGDRAGTSSPGQRVPRWAVQTSEQVARAIVHCLRRPRAEVWPFAPMRVLAGLVTIFPGLADLAGRIRPRQGGRLDQGRKSM